MKIMKNNNSDKEKEKFLKTLKEVIDEVIEFNNKSKNITSLCYFIYTETKGRLN